MTTHYKNIKDFIGANTNCCFCGKTLFCRISNFVGLNRSALSNINAAIVSDSDITSFNFSNTTNNYSVKAEANLNIDSNRISFVVEDCSFSKDPTYAGQTTYDEQIICQWALNSFKPYIEIYCGSKSCKLKYCVFSEPFHLLRMDGDSKWIIPSIRLFLESIQTKNWNILNNYINSTTNIYSRSDNDIIVEPITTGFIDFKSMDQDKLLNKIKTLVVFS